jgi:ATP citrate (pro-S)-lyase
MITADHGAMVSGAHNTIVASRAGKDLISSLCSGLLTIGDYFGGALNEAGLLFYEASKNEEPKDFIKRMNKEHKLISGIGHKIKTKDNPDKRVEILYNYVKEHFPKYETVNYGFKVEAITLQKRNNLILNVDGFIACSLIDCMYNLDFSEDEIDEVLENGLFNGFFVLGRTIGFIGHWYDQRRLKQGLFRLNKNDIKYLK